MNTSSSRLGLTRSGKIIAPPVMIDTRAVAMLTDDYTTADRFDAYALFEYLISRDLRRFGRTSPEINRYVALARIHEDLLTDEDRSEQMSILALTTAFDVAKHGKSRADHIFLY